MCQSEIQIEWNDWEPFSDWADNSRVPQERGVYQVRACVAQGISKTISRCCGADESGVLYIGEGQLDVRLGKLQYLGQSKSKFHHGFIETFEYYGLNRIANREMTEVRWATVPNSKEAEKQLIDAYKRKFGDLPPGNLKLSG